MVFFVFIVKCKKISSSNQNFTNRCSATMECNEQVSSQSSLSERIPKQTALHQEDQRASPFLMEGDTNAASSEKSVEHLVLEEPSLSDEEPHKIRGHTQFQNEKINDSTTKRIMQIYPGEIF